MNFQNGERLRIRIIGPQGQLYDQPFWFTVTGTMSVEDVALQFAQTIQPGMFVSIKTGSEGWTFQKETHAGHTAVRRTHKLPTARYRESRETNEARRGQSGPQPNQENRARLASYIAHAIMYDVSTSPHDLVAAYHVTPEEAQAVLSQQGAWFGPGGKGYAAFVKHIEKALKSKEWFSAPDSKAIPGAARGYGRYVWLLENAAPKNTDQGRKDASDIEDLQRELNNVGFNGWGLEIDNWPEAQTYYNAAPSVYRKHGAHETREPHVVRDFNTLDDLIAHAGRELGATHVSGDGPTTKIYFPRSGEYPYEAASVRRKGGYWHADGPGAREGVKRLPAGARPIGGHAGRRAAEVHDRPETSWEKWKRAVINDLEREVPRLEATKIFDRYRYEMGVRFRNGENPSDVAQNFLSVWRNEPPHMRAHPRHRASEARPLTQVDLAKTLGEKAAAIQIQSAHFDDWVRTQIIEAYEAEKRDPNSVHPLKTPEDARRAAHGFLQQLEWDMKRQKAAEEELGFGAPHDEVEAFWKGVHKGVMDSVPGVADMILAMRREIVGASPPRRRPSKSKPKSRRSGRRR